VIRDGSWRVVAGMQIIERHEPTMRALSPVVSGRRRGVWLALVGSRETGMGDNRTPKPEELDLAALIGAIATRQDRQAFTVLFACYAPRLKTYLMRCGAAAGVAEELAQETLLILWRKAHYFDPTRASASAWIFAIARNLRIDRLRRDQRARLYSRDEHDRGEPPEAPDQLLLCAERDALVRDALKKLSADQVRVIELSFFQGQAHSEIAATLGIPLGTVKSRLRLAMNRLRELLVRLT
jgi:RNA polymerase sigma-70 factor (ECF subfamily)